MPNCTCNNPLREGESVCDACLLKRYDLYDKRSNWELCDFYDVAEALRRAEKAGESTEEEK